MTTAVKGGWVYTETAIGSKPTLFQHCSAQWTQEGAVDSVLSPQSSRSKYQQQQQQFLVTLDSKTLVSDSEYGSQTCL